MLGNSDFRFLSEIGNILINTNPIGGAAREWIEFLRFQRSPTESKWRSFGRMVIENNFKDKVIFEGYEWVTFKLPGASYTPDYVYILQNGKMIFVEVKAIKTQANYRDARTHLRIAASLNPWFTFIEARSENGEWPIEVIHPDTKLIDNLVQGNLT